MNTTSLKATLVLYFLSRVSNNNMGDEPTCEVGST
jgi:hypothetical protein